MGAWEIQTFEDDTALDFLDEWVESENAVIEIRERLEAALQSTDFDYDAGQVATTAAAVIEFVLSPSTAPDIHEALEDNELVSSWLEKLDKGKVEGLLTLAIEVLTRLVEDEGSELRELWEENEVMYPDWMNFNQRRLTRLKELSA